MAYTLQAIVVVADEIQSQLLPPIRSVSLGSAVKLIPLGSEATRHLGIPFLRLTDEGKTETPPQVVQLCKHLSQGRALAYIEAEFFGGAGAQASAVFTKARRQRYQDESHFSGQSSSNLRARFSNSSALAGMVLEKPAPPGRVSYRKISAHSAELASADIAGRSSAKISPGSIPSRFVAARAIASLTVRL